MEEPKGGKLPFWVKFAYGGAEGSTVIFWTLIYMFFAIFMTDVVKMSPAAAAWILLIATIWDAVTDPAVGIWSDRAKFKHGRRRPFIIAMALPLGIAGWLLFTNWHLSHGWTIAYYVMAVIIFFTVYTLLGVPYMALAPEMTQDYDERSRLIAYRMGWSQVFTLVGIVGFFLADEVFPKIVGGRSEGWSLMAAIFGFIAIFPILLTWRATRGYELFPEHTELKLKDVWNDALKNRTFMYTMGVYTAGVVAMDISATVLVYFAKYNLHYSTGKTDMILLILIGVTVFWVPVIAVCATRWGKRAAYMVFAASWLLAQSIGVLFIYPGRDAFLYVIIVVASAGVCAVPFVAWAMVPDAVEVDELKTGQRREGLYSGIATFVQKVGTGVALWIVLNILGWVGYRPDVAQTHTALLGIRLVLAWGTGFFLIASIVLCYFLPMTKKRHDALCEAIRLKKEGKEWDEESLEGLL